MRQSVHLTCTQTAMHEAVCPPHLQMETELVTRMPQQVCHSILGVLLQMYSSAPPGQSVPLTVGHCDLDVVVSEAVVTASDSSRISSISLMEKHYVITDEGERLNLGPCSHGTDRLASSAASHLLRSRMAAGKSPAAASSAARLHFWIQRWEAGRPGVGATNTLSAPATACGWLSSGGSSKSCRPCHFVEHDQHTGSILIWQPTWHRREWTHKTALVYSCT